MSKETGPGEETCVPTSKNKRRHRPRNSVNQSVREFKIQPHLSQKSINAYYTNDFRHRFPSTGILALVYCLERFPNSTVSLHGFDFASETPRIGHYWEKIFKLRTVHSLKLEKQFVGKLVESGRGQIL